MDAAHEHIEYLGKLRGELFEHATSVNTSIWHIDREIADLKKVKDELSERLTVMKTRAEAWRNLHNTFVPDRLTPVASA